MNDKKEEANIDLQPIQEDKKNLLEFGEYRIFGPESGEISIDKIELKSVTGANRIWKVKSIDKKQIVLEIIKFG